MLFTANPLPMWVYDLETLCFLEVNGAALVQYGYSREEFLAMSIGDIRPPEDHARLRASVAERQHVLEYAGSWRHLRADGTILEVEVTSHLLDWEDRKAALVVAYDVTETRRLQAELSRRDLHDQATGLANAALFTDRTAVALARAKAEGGYVGVILASLRNLEVLATAAGEDAADAIVIEAAARLRACCGTQESLARLGSARFAILRETRDEHEILTLASSVVAALARPVTFPGQEELRSSPAVGIALASGEGDNAASLVRNATSAMHHAAERGGDQFVVFNAELLKSTIEDFDIEQALGGAARLGQLYLHYQPIVDLNDGEIVACEALLRWEHPVRGLVGPDRFIPLAERSGLIVEIGAWVIEHAIAEAANWPVQ
ncbi:MAG: EAL domain-containing protein, partial [Acidimicrobiales bacterium]